MLIVICGATATGKSGLALEIAQRLNTVIISADSRQVYREFDIGTAKPSIAEQKLVPHYLIDICDPTETLTLAEYQQYAQKCVGAFRETPLLSNPEGESFLQKFPPLLVGGTGLYLKSITKGLKIPRVAPQPELRSQLSTLGTIQLHAFLSQIDPAAAKKIHINDQFRILRALEVFYVTGIPISEQQGENPPDYPILHIGLDCDVEALDQRIALRTNKMVELGLIEEVTNLCQKYGGDLPLLNTLGYAEIKQYLTGDLSLNDAIALIVTHTRQFAKRQRTWFRNDPEINWFDNSSPDLIEQVWTRIQEFIAVAN
jgi:tRNA dimethylallyltransferase